MKVGELSFHTEKRKILKKVLPSSVGLGQVNFLAGQVAFKAYLSNGQEFKQLIPWQNQ